MATKPHFIVTGSRDVRCDFCLRPGGKLLLDKNSGKVICTDCLHKVTALIKQPPALPAPKEP